MSELVAVDPHPREVVEIDMKVSFIIHEYNGTACTRVREGALAFAKLLGQEGLQSAHARTNMDDSLG